MRDNRLDRLEVLAPAGSLDHVRAAISAGADAVYVGIKGISARPDPWGFDLEGAAEAARLLHESGRRIYYALNAEFASYRADAFWEALTQTAEGGCDAFILGDWSLVRKLSQLQLTIPVHASTLLGAYNVATARFLHKLGVTRMILSTSLYIQEIAPITLGCPELEYEMIAFGGFCFGDNRRCRLPHYMHKGRYTVGCHLQYIASTVQSGTERGKPVDIGMPDCDVSTMLHAYVDLGITSFKIEGRTRSTAYVAESTGRLRRAVDALRERGELGLSFHYLANVGLKGAPL